MCKSCVDDGALSQATYDAIEVFLGKYPEAEFGPAHIVLSDCNVLDGYINWCLGLARAALTHDATSLSEKDAEHMNKLDWYKDQDNETLRATIEFLEKLLAIPEEER